MRNKKRCPKCNTVKPLSQFYKTKSGVQSYCMLCSKKIIGDWQKANKDKYNAYQSAHRRANKPKYNAIKQRHREKYPGRQKARQLTAWYRKTRDILGIECISCGTRENVEFAHLRYDLPYLVIFLCHTCHKNFDNGKLTLHPAVLKELSVDMRNLEIKR